MGDEDASRSHPYPVSLSALLYRQLITLPPDSLAEGCAPWQDCTSSLAPCGCRCTTSARLLSGHAVGCLVTSHYQSPRVSSWPYLVGSAARDTPLWEMLTCSLASDPTVPHSA